MRVKLESKLVENKKMQLGKHRNQATPAAFRNCRDQSTHTLTNLMLETQKIINIGYHCQKRPFNLFFSAAVAILGQ